MSAFRLPEVPTTGGWVHDNHNSWVTYDVKEMGRVRLLVNADKKACPCSQNPNDPTTHIHTYFGAGLGGVPFGRSYTCDSHSRYYNPKTGEIEGRAHCTCDFCY